MIGRFLQADPIIQEPYLSQSYNRYSYVINNPLSLTDPSGFSWWVTWRRPLAALFVAWAVPKSMMEMFNLAAAQGSAFAFNMLNTATTAGGSFSPANAAASIAGGMASGAKSGGNFESAIIGGFKAMASAGIGEAFDAHGGTTHLSTLGKAGHVAAHATAGCVSEGFLGFGEV